MPQAMMAEYDRTVRALANMWLAHAKAGCAPGQTAHSLLARIRTFIPSTIAVYRIRRFIDGFHGPHGESLGAVERQRVHDWIVAGARTHAEHHLGMTRTEPLH